MNRNLAKLNILSALQICRRSSCFVSKKIIFPALNASINRVKENQIANNFAWTKPGTVSLGERYFGQLRSPGNGGQQQSSWQSSRMAWKSDTILSMLNNQPAMEADDDSTETQQLFAEELKEDLNRMIKHSLMPNWVVRLFVKDLPTPPPELRESFAPGIVVNSRKAQFWIRDEAMHVVRRHDLVTFKKHPAKKPITREMPKPRPLFMDLDINKLRQTLKDLDEKPQKPAEAALKCAAGKKDDPPGQKETNVGQRKQQETADADNTPTSEEDNTEATSTGNPEDENLGVFYTGEGERFERTLEDIPEGGYVTGEGHQLPLETDEPTANAPPKAPAKSPMPKPPTAPSGPSAPAKKPLK